MKFFPIFQITKHARIVGSQGIDWVELICLLMKKKYNRKFINTNFRIKIIAVIK